MTTLVFRFKIKSAFPETSSIIIAMSCITVINIQSSRFPVRIEKINKYYMHRTNIYQTICILTNMAGWDGH